MPHLHLRTSADLPENMDLPDILEGLAARLAGAESVDPASVKAYHTLHTHWAMGTGAPAGFAHLTLSLLDGRTEALLQEIGDSLFSELRSRFACSLEQGEIALTMELRAIAKALYWKAT